MLDAEQALLQQLDQVINDPDVPAFRKPAYKKLRATVERVLKSRPSTPAIRGRKQVIDHDEVHRLRATTDLTMREIAEQLGCSVSAVNYILRRSR